MFDWSSGKSGVRISHFPDDTSAIDFILEEQMVQRIYAAWDESEFGALVDFGGGVKAITAKMLVEAGEPFLTGIKNIGQVRASQILEEVRATLREVPYGSGI